MKGLLQSKKFKNNLKKWLCMYVGVMLLLTTVITYSKYISKFQGSTKASPAKFQIELEPFDIDQSTHLATDELTYKFYVDVSNVDVASTLKILTFVDESFNIVSTSDGFVSQDNNETTQLGKKMLVYKAKVPTDLSGKKEFEITVKYNNSDNLDLSTDYNNPSVFEKIVTIGYKIEQDSK